MNRRLKYFNEIQIMRNGMEQVRATNGRVDISARDLQAGVRCTIEIAYTAGLNPIAPGGVIRFTIPFGFTRPQIDMPLKPGYTTVRSETPGVTVKLFMVENQWWKRGPDRTKQENVSEHVGTHVWARVTGNVLREGDRIVLVYGDASYSPFGAAEACLTTGPVQFDVATDQNGRLEAPYSGYYLTDNPPILHVHPLRAEKLEVVIPSEIQSGQRFRVHLFAVDPYRNLDDRFVGRVALLLNGKPAGEYRIGEADCGIKTVDIPAPERPADGSPLRVEAFARPAGECEDEEILSKFGAESAASESQTTSGRGSLAEGSAAGAEPQPDSESTESHGSSEAEAKPSEPSGVWRKLSAADDGQPDGAQDSQNAESAPEGKSDGDAESGDFNEPASLPESGNSTCEPCLKERLAADGTLLRGVSNPAVVGDTSAETRHYWGDLHGHTGIQWGRGSGRSYYEYAREVAALDFCALTDPDAGRYTNNNETARASLSCYMSDGQWEIIRRINQEYYTPGRFVPILGYEYHNDAPNPEFGGDRNVYFDNYDQPILRCCDPGSYCPGELWETFRKRRINALTIPHHTAKKVMLGSWDVHDVEYQRLVEIYSCWGSSEAEGCERPIIGGAVYDGHSVHHALSKGFRLGFVSGSDTHAGNPGYAHWVFSDHENSYRGGLTCVMTKELTLPSIFQAMRDRRVYATTGERILLDFSINESCMGTELPYAENPERRLNVSVHGTGEIDFVDIVSMGQVVYSVSGNGASSLVFEWSDDSALKDGWTYYYVRVLQKDKAMAWSSPIWIQ